MSCGVRPGSGRGAGGTEEGGDAFARRYIGHHPANDGACQEAGLEAEFGGRHRERAAAMRMHVLAGTVARRGLLVRMSRARDAVVSVGLGIHSMGVHGVIVLGVTVLSVIVQAVPAVRMHVERLQDRRIGVQAARAHGNGNQDEAQKLAGQKAHRVKQAEKFECGQAV
jgi:hypothetical protein